ncbi:MAG: hypothetical protein IAE97_08500 [Chthoniobacterales bacterium]|nr:hypothetical protein [Chthoniobacterales bacterium]
MKRILIIFTSLLLVGTIYVLSYHTSHIHQARPGDNGSFSLVILGISLPYNSTTIWAFTSFYRPLIERAAAQMPARELQGTIRRIDLGQSELMIAREGKDGILLQIPDSMKDRLKDFNSDDFIRATYGFRPVKNAPFCQSYELRTIELAKR